MDIFLIEIKNSDNIEQSLLSEFQKKNFSDPEKQKEHCLAYLMTDRILKEFYSVKDREIEFVNKKPFLKSREIYFSISHSGNYIAIGFSKHNCGIDIEKRKQRNFESISKRMNFKATTEEEFYCEWTKFEAEYKLAEKAKELKHFSYEDYIITACSDNPEENFELYIQNGNVFPKANI